jgi:hypothetical protein
LAQEECDYVAVVVVVAAAVMTEKAKIVLLRMSLDPVLWIACCKD